MPSGRSRFRVLLPIFALSLVSRFRVKTPDFAFSQFLSESPPAQSRAGFTLVEVLVAAVLLAVGISAGVRALGAMEQASAAAADRQTAVRLAGERLALIEGVEGVSAGSTAGQFDSAPRFRWQQQISAAPNVTGVLQVTVTVAWPEGTMTRHYAVSTYLLDPSQQAANQTAAGGGA